MTQPGQSYSLTIIVGRDFYLAFSTTTVYLLSFGQLLLGDLLLNNLKVRHIDPSLQPCLTFLAVSCFADFHWSTNQLHSFGTW